MSTIRLSNRIGPHELVSPKRQDRPGPIDLYWPPDDGYPRLPTFKLEALWLMSQGASNSTIAQLTGCYKSYPYMLKSRLSKLSEEKILELFDSIPWPKP